MTELHVMYISSKALESKRCRSKQVYSTTVITTIKHDNGGYYVN